MKKLLVVSFVVFVGVVLFLCAELRKSHCKLQKIGDAITANYESQEILFAKTALNILQDIKEKNQEELVERLNGTIDSYVLYGYKGISAERKEYADSVLLRIAKHRHEYPPKKPRRPKEEWRRVKLYPNELRDYEKVQDVLNKVLKEEGAEQSGGE